MSQSIISELYSLETRTHNSNVTTSSQYLVMNDATKLAIDVLLPSPLTPGDRVSALMIMTRYWRSFQLRIPAPPHIAPPGPREDSVNYFLQQGFAVIVVDARGSGASYGSSPCPWSERELSDYSEVVQWIIRQPWSNGKIGAYGISYEGATALRLLALKGPSSEAVRAVIPQEIEFDVYTDIAFPGGIFNQSFIKAWSDSNELLDQNRSSKIFPWWARPLIKGVRPVDEDRRSHSQLNEAVLQHRANTNIFQALSNIVFRDDRFGDSLFTVDDFSVFKYNQAIPESNKPIFIWGSWFDGASAEAALRVFNTYSNPQVCVIGAWNHEMTEHGSPYGFGQENLCPSQKQRWQGMNKFFRQVLDKDDMSNEKKLYYFTLGEEVWKKTSQFPPSDSQVQNWYFQQSGFLTSSPPSVSAYSDYHVDFSASTGTTNRWHTQMAKPLK